MEIGLEAKRALVTGGADGIGWAVARALTAEGAQVAVADVNTDRLDAARKEGMVAIACNFADAAATEAAVAEAARLLGGLDVLVNNVGVAGPVGPPEATAVADFVHTLAINVTSHFVATRAAIATLRAAGGGAVVNVASSVIHDVGPDRAAYVTSKFAVVGLTRALAKDLGRYAIRVNAIAPGAVEGPRIERVLAAEAAAAAIPLEEARRRMLAASSLGLLNRAEDIARMVVFLAGEPGLRVSGHVFTVDADGV